MALDILGISIMSNHIHVVVRNRPDVVAHYKVGPQAIVSGGQTYG